MEQQAEGGMPCDDSFQPETHQFDQQHTSTPSDEQRRKIRTLFCWVLVLFQFKSIKGTMEWNGTNVTKIVIL
jgi:hypothetical protein